MSAARMNCEQWIEVFLASGVDAAMMHKWHCEFERLYPDQHHEFLRWIDLPEEKIAFVRKSSRAG